MTDRSTPPAIRLTDSIPFIRPQSHLLDNGLTVCFLEGGSEDIMKIELVFLSGSYHQNDPLVAFATTKLLGAGTVKMSQEQISEMLDYHGASLQLNPQKDIVSVGIHLLGKHLRPLLGLLQEILLQPLFPAEELQTFLKNQQQIHIINQKKVQHLARTIFNELIYGEAHPYGYRVKTEDFEGMERESLLQFHRNWFRPANAFCIVSGHLPANTGKLLESCLGSGSWGASEVASPPVYPLISPGSRKVFLEVPGSLQSAIRIGKQLFNRTHPAYHRLKIANAMLGGYFGSRLMQNIRQDKGFTYGIGSNLVSLLRNGYFFISTQVGTGVRQAATNEIYKELHGLRTRPASHSELDTLRNYLSANFLRSFDGPFAQSERLKERLVFGLDFAHDEAYIKELLSVTPEQLMEVAGNYLHEDGMMEVVVGK